MGRLAEEIKRKGIKSFKQKFNILDNVDIRLARDIEHEVEVFPLVAITEGGLRFSVSRFLRLIFHRLNLSPRSVTHNFYRIVNGINEINRRYGFHLSEWDLLYCYSIQKVKKGENKWYLKSHPDKVLVHILPDNIKGLKDDLCVVTGQWMHSPEEDSFPPIIVGSLDPDDRIKKSWVKGNLADFSHIEEVLKFLGGPDTYPFIGHGYLIRLPLNT